MATQHHILVDGNSWKEDKNGGEKKGASVNSQRVQERIWTADEGIKKRRE